MSLSLSLVLAASDDDEARGWKGDEEGQLEDGKEDPEEVGRLQEPVRQQHTVEEP
eukprot:CAMPEP_0196744310 /NCGR_PEP_ID=MMETSP1091-20130531/56863_1 /TAXON_ID=302021 /ORGANISM="Rhodomonas sp., Strain CCMP768" /LENGTH=54 /DNA_ID=CAMNT_0042090819 /DNA_START=226 /DNA_END=391 /DNA_ORIENTATION=+